MNSITKLLDLEDADIIITDTHIEGTVKTITLEVKDLKRMGRGYKNFEHFRNRFLYSTRNNPVLDGVADFNPVKYFEEDDF